MTGPWQAAQVVDVRRETASATTIRLRPERPLAHLAGQHVVVRLTAPDGYTASRSYSVATAPSRDPEFELSVQRLTDGEVSPFLCDEVRIGDTLEIRGPIGRFFAWEPGTPALFVGGGSGVVPVMAMLRAARLAGYPEVHLWVSARRPDELFYADELLERPDATVVYSRAPGPGGRPPGRLAASDLARVPDGVITAFVCGSSGFADHAAGLLIGAGIPTEQIRIERFGAT